MNPRKLLDWRTALILIHRWMGIAFGLLFIVWFVSGIAFMYWGMPSLSAGERMDRQAWIDLSTATVAPGEAAERHGLRAASFRIDMEGDRPVYRFGSDAVYADTGDRVEPRPAGPDDAVDIVRRWVPEHVSTIRHDRLLEDSDQWTLQGAQRSQMPLHRIAVGDDRGTYYYVAEGTGRIVMKTDRPGRIQGFLSGVLHWVYFTPLRKHGALWNQFIIWGSFAGGFMCILGIVLGIWRYSPSARVRRAGGPSRSPYSGLMLWHHYAGLLFGLVTFTWVLSGAFSVNPFGMFSGSTGLSAEQRSVITGGPRDTGGPLDPGAIGLEALQVGMAAITAEIPVKEAEVRHFRGEPYLIASPPPSDLNPLPRAEGPADHRIVSLTRPELGTFTSFGHAAMEEIADEIMPGVAVRDRTWLDRYDAYYRSRDGTRPLPVLRVRYLDDQRSWLYLDPRTGSVTLEHRHSRARRWLYDALHELDIPWLYERRVLRDLVVIVLSLGGILLAGTTLWSGWKRVPALFRRGG